MSSQLGLDFQLQPFTGGPPSGACTRTERPCAECGEPRTNQKPGRFCGSICRSRASKRRRLQQAERRNRGKAIAGSNNAPELEAARLAALQVLRLRGVCIISHVREYCEENDIRVDGRPLDFTKNWVASVFWNSPWFDATGRRESTFHVGSNARKVNEYRLSEKGREKLQMVGE